MTLAQGLDWTNECPHPSLPPAQENDAPHISRCEASRPLFSLPPGSQAGQLRQVPAPVRLALHRLQRLLLHHATCYLSYMVSLRRPLTPQEA